MVHALAAITCTGSPERFDAVLTQNFAPISRQNLNVVLLHDVLFVDHPEWFSAKERVYLSGIRPSLRRADVVLTTSRSETDRISALWPELASKVAPVGLAVPCGFGQTEGRKPSVDPEVLERPYVLSVGRLNIRKNHRRLVEAYKDSDLRKSHNLLLVGAPDGRAGDLAEVDGVHVLSGVSDAELRWLYEHAALYIFPSLGEGFGLPLYEAAWFGLPIVASDLPVFRETGLVSEFFDPTDIGDIRGAIDRGLDARPVRLPEDSTWEHVVRRARAAIQSDRRPR